MLWAPPSQRWGAWEEGEPKAMLQERFLGLGGEFLSGLVNSLLRQRPADGRWRVRCGGESLALIFGPARWKGRGGKEAPLGNLGC